MLRDVHKYVFCFHIFAPPKNVDPVRRFWVDDIPIREFVRNETATPYPNHQPMKALTSIWDGSTWATQGGRIGVNWTAAPFVATYRNYTLNGCSCTNTTTAIAACQNSKYAIASAAARNLTGHRLNQMKGVRSHWLKYDYCWFADRQIYPECNYNVV